MTAHSTDIETKDGLSRWRCSCHREGPWQSTALAARRGGIKHAQSSDRPRQPCAAPCEHSTSTESLYSDDRVTRYRWRCTCGTKGERWYSRVFQAEQGAANHRRQAGGRAANSEAKVGT